VTARAHLGYTGGEWKSSALQALAVGANKLVFQTTVRTARGITWASNSDATVLTAGLYGMASSLKVNFGSGNSFGLSFGPSSGYIAGDGMYLPEDFSNSTTDIAAALPCIWLDAGATVSAYVYNNNGAQNSNFARPATFKLYKVG
jgi:hypothetical protein